MTSVAQEIESILTGEDLDADALLALAQGVSSNGNGAMPAGAMDAGHPLPAKQYIEAEHRAAWGEEIAGQFDGGLAALDGRNAGLSGLTMRDIKDTHNLHAETQGIWQDILAEGVHRPKAMGADPLLYVSGNQVQVVRDYTDPDGRIRKHALPMSSEIIRDLMAQSSYFFRGHAIEVVAEGHDFDLEDPVKGYSPDAVSAILDALDAHPGKAHGRAFFRPASPGDGKKIPPNPDQWGIRYPVEVYPPRTLAGQMMGIAGHALPRLNAIAHRPVLSQDGKQLLTANGYHAQDGIYMDYPGELMMAHPGNADDAEDAVRRAFGKLTDVFGEFEFEDLASRANFIAMLLSGIVNPACEIPPGFLIGKSTPGTGASLLSRLATIIIAGRSDPSDVPPKAFGDDAELIKAMTTAAINQQGVIRFDNLTGVVDSAELNAYLTSAIYARRILGGNRITEVARRNHLDLMTANNAILTKEIAERVVNIRLHTDTPDPASREFRIEDIESHVKERRDELLGALLDVVDAAIRFGNPGAPGKTPVSMGRFPQWKRVLWGILSHAASCFDPESEWAGVLEQFLGNQIELDAFLSDADDDLAEAASWMARQFAGMTFTAKDIQTMALTAKDADGAMDPAGEWLTEVDASKQSYAIRSMLGKLLKRPIQIEEGKIARLTSASDKGQGRKRRFRIQVADLEGGQGK